MGVERDRMWAQGGREESGLGLRVVGFMAVVPTKSSPPFLGSIHLHMFTQSSASDIAVVGLSRPNRLPWTYPKAREQMFP